MLLALVNLRFQCIKYVAFFPAPTFFERRLEWKQLGLECEDHREQEQAVEMGAWEGREGGRERNKEENEN